MLLADFLWGTTTDANGQVTYRSTVPNGKGNATYSFTFYATKVGYTDSAVATRQAQVSHIVNPNVTISGISPSPNSNLAGQTTILYWNVNSPITQIVLLGASIFPTGTATSYSDPANDLAVRLSAGNFQVNRSFAVPSNAPPGTYDVLVAVYADTNGNGVIDGADNVLGSLKATGAFTIAPPPDTQGPTVTITSPLNNAVVANASLQVSGTASDSGFGNSGISSVTVNGVNAGGTTNGAGTGNWSAAIALNSGVNTINVVANDNSPNQNPRTQSITVTYNAPATITMSSSPSTGGTVSGGGTFTLGSQHTVIATPNANYSFANWTEGANVVSNSASYTFTVNGSRTLIANFTQTNYAVAVTASPANGGTASGSGTFAAGSQRTVSAAPSSGYNFVNWTEGGNAVSGNANYTFTLNGPRTLVANFTQVTYAVSVNATPAVGGTVNGGGTFSGGTQQTVIATASANYSFVSWTEGGNTVSNSPNYTFTLNAARTLVANFTTTTYPVALSASPVAGGTVSGGGTFSGGSQRTVTATPNANYGFVSWTEGGNVVSNSASYTFTMNGPRILVANFTPSPVNYAITLSALPNAGGTVSGIGTYQAGTSRTVTALANSGYMFSNWTEEGAVVSASPSYTFTLSASRALVANFISAQYLVTPSAGANGSISPNTAQPVNSGGSAPFTATPANGYLVDQWLENNVVIQTGGNTHTVGNVVANVALQVTFKGFSSGENIVSYSPPGWSDRIVVSNVKNATSSSAKNIATLSSADTLYVSWAQRNEGSNATSVGFNTELFVDGASKQVWFSAPPVAAGLWNYVPNYPIGSLSEGTHTIKIVVDSTNTITESDESDNEYTKTITVAAPPQFQPDGLIGLTTPQMVGYRIYDAGAIGETLSTRLARGAGRTALVLVQNNGEFSDTIRVQGDSISGHFAVSYYDGATNITAQVLAGRLEFRNLPPGGRHWLKIVIYTRATATVGEQSGVTLHLKSANDPNAQDAVRLEAIAR